MTHNALGLSQSTSQVWNRNTNNKVLLHTGNKMVFCFVFHNYCLHGPGGRSKRAGVGAEHARTPERLILAAAVSAIPGRGRRGRGGGQGMDAPDLALGDVAEAVEHSVLVGRAQKDKVRSQ